MKRMFAFLLVAFTLNGIQATASDSLYIPINLQQAYEKGTRAYDGSPGPEYWQNHADYVIQVKFEPERRMIFGRQKIIYYNESPDSLDRLVIRLYQDLFKKGNPRDWGVNPGDLHEGVKIDSLKLNDRPLDLTGNPSIRRYGTNMIIRLQNKIAPESTVKLEIEWQLQISRHSNIRMGAYDSTSFHVAYWYPQIAVYDDLSGWDTFNYTGLQEFYNDFNNYDVRISVPQNFVVWATGRLQNVEEVLQEKYQKRYQKALESDDVIHVITEEDLEKGKITADKEWNTFHYVARNVPDFAFSTSDHYLWDLTSVQVAPDRERVLVGAAYKAESSDFYKVAELSRKSILFFSNEMPAVAFPYPSLTVFNGRGGMEFPMMVNDGSVANWQGTVHLTSHEIAHTYFPFMMGTNERKYAWMDEGWAVMLPFDFQAREAPGYDPIEKAIKRYLSMAGTELDIPMIVPSVVYGGDARNAYRNASYNRSGVAYYLLERHLGRETFLKAMHAYMTRWQSKHPMPFDFFFTFNHATGEDLNWFFKPWFFEFGYPDLAIEKVAEDQQTLTVKVIKKGNLPLPIKLTVVFQDSSQTMIEKAMDIWRSGKNETVIKISKEKPIIEIQLGDKHIPDLFDDNNWIRMKE